MNEIHEDILVLPYSNDNKTHHEAKDISSNELDSSLLPTNQCVYTAMTDVSVHNTDSMDLDGKKENSEEMDLTAGAKESGVGRHELDQEQEDYDLSAGTKATCSFVKQSDMQQNPVQTIFDLIHTFNGKTMTSRRVKFYQADSECGQWEESGIGIMHLVPGNARFDDIHIQVFHAQQDDETSSSDILLDTIISENETYCLQNRRIITWVSNGRPHCLSFVKQSSCSIFWSLLNLIASDRIGEEEDEEDGVEEEDEDVVGSEGEEEEEEEDDEERQKPEQQPPSEDIEKIDGNTRLNYAESSFPSDPVDSSNHREHLACNLFASCETEDTNQLGTPDVACLTTCVKSNPMFSQNTKEEANPLAEKNLYSAPQTVHLGESFHLLKQYDDSLSHGSLDSSGSDRSCSNRLLTSMPFPESAETLTDCFSCLHILEHNVASFPSEVSQILLAITDSRWLTSLWALLDRAIEASDEALCSNIAEFLWRVVYICFHRTNPFLSLSVTSESERFLKSCDPLVRLLSDANYLHFFRAMEYEAECRKHWIKVNHVDFFEKCCKFKQVICQNDKTFKTTSHFIYRLIYLRDVCLPRHLDDQTLQRVNSIINAGYSYLCRVIQHTPNSIAELRDLIPEDPAAARFLHQLLCIFRASTDISFSLEKYRVFGALRSERVIEALEPYLTGNCTAVRVWRKDAKSKAEDGKQAQRCQEDSVHTDVVQRYRHHILAHGRPTVLTPAELAVEIFYLAVECRPGVVRSALLRQAEEKAGEHPTFWYALCNVFHRTNNEGLQMQLCELFKKLLDPVTMESPEKDDFLGLFYDKGVLDRLIYFLLTPTPLTFSDLMPSDEFGKSRNGSCNFRSSYPYFLAGFTDQDHDEEDESEQMSYGTTQREEGGEADIILNSEASLHSLEEQGAASSLDTQTPYNRKKRPKNGDSYENFCETEEKPRDDSEKSQKTGKHSYQQKVYNYLSELSRVDQQQLLVTSRLQLSSLKCRIVEILAFCVLKHSSRIKYRNFRQNLHLHIIKMSCEPVFDSCLASCAVKFLRTCLAAEPEHYARIFIRHNIFHPILTLLKSSLSTNFPRSRCEGSLLESVILEFFNFLSLSVDSSPSIASLVKCLFKKYSTDCKTLAQFYRETCQFDLFQVLQAQYDEMQASEKRGSKSDSMDSHYCFSTSMSNSLLASTTDGSKNHSSVQYPSYRARPTNRLSVRDSLDILVEVMKNIDHCASSMSHFGVEEAEREIEDLYFQLDDEIPENYPSAYKQDYTSETQQGSALQPSVNPPMDHRTEHRVDSHKDSPSFSQDDDEDESDVPTFLKSSCNSCASITPSQSSAVMPCEPSSKPICHSIKVQLQSSSAFMESNE